MKGGDNLYNIYKITNKVNNMIYIGCTTKSVEERFSGHLSAYRHKNNDLYLAMREYGIDNFIVELVEHGTNDTIRYDREKFYISKFDSMNPNIGYNRTIGGTGTIGYIFTDEDKLKISKAGMGRKVSIKTIKRMSLFWKGKHLPKAVRSKISKSRMGKYTGEDNPFFGRHHTNETKKKILETKKSLGLLRPVIGISTTDDSKIKFDSLSDAGRYIQDIRGGSLSTLVSHIGNSIIGRYGSKSAYGYTWKYIEKSND